MVNTKVLAIVMVFIWVHRASLVAQTVKNLLAMQEMWVRSLSWEDPLEKEMATHSSISCLENHMDRGAWWVVYSPWGHKESDTAERLTLSLCLLFLSLCSHLIFKNFVEE